MKEQCKYLYNEMKRREPSTGRACLCEFQASLNLDGVDYRQIYYIVYDNNGHNLDLKPFEKRGFKFYASEISDFTEQKYIVYLYKKSKGILIKTFSCPPTLSNIIREILYKRDKLLLLLCLYSLFTRMLVKIRAAVNTPVHAARAAAYIAARAAAYIAYIAASDAALAASDAAYISSVYIYDSDARTANRNARKAFRELIKFKKILLKSEKSEAGG
jgi:hypothetical protein